MTELALTQPFASGFNGKYGHVTQRRNKSQPTLEPELNNTAERRWRLCSSIEPGTAAKRQPHPCLMGSDVGRSTPSGLAENIKWGLANQGGRRWSFCPSLGTALHQNIHTGTNLDRSNPPCSRPGCFNAGSWWYVIFLSKANGNPSAMNADHKLLSCRNGVGGEMGLAGQKAGQEALQSLEIFIICVHSLLFIKGPRSPPSHVL